MTVYRLTPDLKEVVQQSTMKEPDASKILGSTLHSLLNHDEWQRETEEFDKHIASLPRFPARGFTEKWLGVDLKENENFCWDFDSKGNKICAKPITEDTITAAGLQATLEKGKPVAIPATEETIFDKIYFLCNSAIEREKLREEDWPVGVMTDILLIKQLILDKSSRVIAGASSQKEEIERLKEENKSLTELYLQALNAP